MVGSTPPISPDKDMGDDKAGSPSLQPKSPDTFEQSSWVKPEEYWGPDRPLKKGGPYAGRYVLGSQGALTKVVPLPNKGFRRPHRPEIVADGVQAEALAIRAASLRGASHQEREEPRQDSYGFALTKDHCWLMLVVADGVSEGWDSEIAADLVCWYGIRLLGECLNNQDIDAIPWKEVVEKIRDSLRDEAKRIAREYEKQRDYGFGCGVDEMGDKQLAAVMSATAEFVVVATSADEGGSHRFARCSIGDSRAYLLDAKRGWRDLGPRSSDESSSEVVTNRVAALPIVGGAEVKVTIDQIKRKQALAVVTDGLWKPLGTGGGEVGGFLATKWESPPDVVDFIHSVAFIRQYFDDDRTAVVVWPR